MRASLPFIALLFVASAAWPITRGSSGPCDHPAPNDFDAVYACMSADRTKNADGSVGPSRFSWPQGDDCREIAMRYLVALTQEGGMSRNRARQYLPSCAIFAQAVEKLTDEPPFWGKCLGAEGGFNGEHFKTCLNYFLSHHRRSGIRGRTLHALGSCKQMINTYEVALRAADRGGNLPAGYTKPECALIADVVGAEAPAIAPKTPSPKKPSPPLFAACLGYESFPLAAHVKKCLGDDLRGFQDCPQVRRVYEERLTDAYGGSLPAGYVMLSCDDASGVLQLAAAQREEERRKHVEEKRRRAEEARRRAVERKRPAHIEPPRRTVSHSSPQIDRSSILFFVFIAFFLYFLFRKKRLKAEVIVYGATYNYVKKHLIHRPRKNSDDPETSRDW